MVCSFCHAKSPTNEKEDLKRIWNQIDEHKNPKAMNMMGVHYFEGHQGLSKKSKEDGGITSTSV